MKKSAPESEKMLNGQQCHNNAVFDLEWMPGDTKFVSASGKNFIFEFLIYDKRKSVVVRR